MNLIYESGNKTTASKRMAVLRAAYPNNLYELRFNGTKQKWQVWGRRPNE
jgi:hypothetical protein